MVPNIISSAALGMLFLCILNPQFGMVNNLISKITGSEFTQNWFLSSNTAFFYGDHDLAAVCGTGHDPGDGRDGIHSSGTV